MVIKQILLINFTSILDDVHIITAAHCVYDKSFRKIKNLRITVVAGTTDLGNISSGIYRYVEYTIIPTSFNINSAVDDIAILQIYIPIRKTHELRQVNRRSRYHAKSIAKSAVHRIMTLPMSVSIATCSLLISIRDVFNANTTIDTQAMHKCVRACTRARVYSNRKVRECKDEVCRNYKRDMYVYLVLSAVAAAVARAHYYVYIRCDGVTSDDDCIMRLRFLTHPLPLKDEHQRIRAVNLPAVNQYLSGYTNTQYATMSGFGTYQQTVDPFSGKITKGGSSPVLKYTFGRINTLLPGYEHLCGANQVCVTPWNPNREGEDGGICQLRRPLPLNFESQRIRAVNLPTVNQYLPGSTNTRFATVSGFGSFNQISARTNIAPRIMGGQFAPSRRFLHQVSLQMIGKGCSFHQCGGSIIDSMHVITAAHCVTDKNTYKLNNVPITIVAGATDLRDKRSGIYRDVEFTYIPKSYSSNFPGYYHDDIAILRRSSGHHWRQNHRHQQFHDGPMSRSAPICSTAADSFNCAKIKRKFIVAQILQCTQVLLQRVTNLAIRLNNAARCGTRIFDMKCCLSTLFYQLFNRIKISKFIFRPGAKKKVGHLLVLQDTGVVDGNVIRKIAPHIVALTPVREKDKSKGDGRHRMRQRERERERGVSFGIGGNARIEGNQRNRELMYGKRQAANICVCVRADCIHIYTRLMWISRITKSFTSCTCATRETIARQKIPLRPRRINARRRRCARSKFIIFGASRWREFATAEHRFSRERSPLDDTMCYMSRSIRTLYLLEDNDVNIHEYAIEDGTSAIHYLCDEFEDRGLFHLSHGHTKKFIDVLLKNPNENYRDAYGFTYFHAACMIGDETTVLRFVAECANIGTYRRWPLHLAARYRHEYIVYVLLEYGANPNQPEHDERSTPLHALAYRCPCDCSTNLKYCGERKPVDKIVGMLVEKGANLEARDRRGETPLQSAVAHFDAGLVAALLKHGASLDALNEDRIFGARLTKFELRNYPFALDVIETTRVLLAAGHRLDLYGRLKMLKWWMRIRANDIDLSFTRFVEYKKGLPYRAIPSHASILREYCFYMEPKTRKKLQHIKYPSVLPTKDFSRESFPDLASECDTEIEILSNIFPVKDASLYEICKMNFNEGYSILKEAKNWCMPNEILHALKHFRLTVKRHIANIWIRPQLELFIADLFMTEYCKLNLPYDCCLEVAKNMDYEELFRMCKLTQEHHLEYPLRRSERLRAQRQLKQA
ncbi:unnamed protein product [Trichogramma brassicae]|uniref:Peptidase S1 domain-containing protein n=1 Tax=Trichogramma brassicae TaxID=86971 RepID=A0A6H5J059_9HYME|nr:unnamed protein product [Trichogramma brassicae]